MVKAAELRERTRERDSRIRLTLALEPEVDQALRSLAEHEHRSLNGQVSYLVMERAREMGLDASGHIREEVRN